MSPDVMLLASVIAIVLALCFVVILLCLFLGAPASERLERNATGPTAPAPLEPTTHHLRGYQPRRAPTQPTPPPSTR